ncbi:MAG: rod shape-determining protein MreD [Clostridiales bacterium]|nr:rod shape-determining protein MreD [Clostridiales bacterium]MBF0978617.1 rod shape-determining protein MreD [Clostridiales bacterium]MBF0986539.1 rod shape-determining protein MreD [Clostridiales bacterium]
MKKFKSFLILLLLFLIIYFLQFNFFTWFNIRGIMPNLFVVFTLFVGIFIGQRIGIAVGLFVGIVIDVIIGKQVGFTGIALGIVGYVGELLDKNFDKNNLLTLLAMVAIVTFGYELVNMFYIIVRNGLNFNIFIFLVMIVVEVLFNVLLVMIFYPLIKKIGHYFEEVFKVKRVLTRYY